MVETGLLSWKHLHPWAEEWIEKLKDPPSWLLRLSVETYQGTLESVLGEEVSREPILLLDLQYFADWATVSLLCRYKSGDLSWAGFLREAGDWSDRHNEGRVDCSWFYGLLNEYEDEEFDERVEARQKLIVLDEFRDLLPLAEARFETFRKGFRRGAKSRRRSASR